MLPSVDGDVKEVRFKHHEKSFHGSFLAHFRILEGYGPQADVKKSAKQLEA